MSRDVGQHPPASRPIVNVLTRERGELLIAHSRKFGALFIPQLPELSGTAPWAEFTCSDDETERKGTPNSRAAARIVVAFHPDLFTFGRCAVPL